MSVMSNQEKKGKNEIIFILNDDWIHISGVVQMIISYIVNMRNSLIPAEIKHDYNGNRSPADVAFVSSLSTGP